MNTKRAAWRRSGDRLAAPRAFTLIELLVVISIMGILAGLTFPVLKQVKRQQYLSAARGELNQLATALDNFKAKYGVYPPGNQNLNSLYLPQDRMQYSQLYYELVGTANNGTAFVTLDGSSQLLVTAVNSAYGVGGFINCSKGGGEDGLVAKNFLPGLSSKEVNYQVMNNGVRTTMLVTSVGGPDQNYQPLSVPGLNPFRYVYPGTNNPGSYDLWVQLVISGKTNLVCNWSKSALLNYPLP